MFELCPPALIYLIFSATQIIIDLFKGLYNTAFMKFIVTTMITLLLNFLCKGGLSVIAWFIVFIPFILMTVIVTMLLYVFGLDIATGKINSTGTCATTSATTSTGTSATTSTGTSTNKTIVIVPKSSFNIFDPNTYPINAYTTIPTAAEVNNYNNIVPANQT